MSQAVSKKGVERGRRVVDGGLCGSSDRMRAVEVNAREANRALEATRPRTASILVFFLAARGENDNAGLDSMEIRN